MTEVIEAPADYEVQRKQQIIKKVKDELKRISNYILNLFISVQHSLFPSIASHD